MSQKEGVTKVIGEHEYTMYMLPPLVSNRLLIKLGKLVSPALGALLDAFSGSKGFKIDELLDSSVESTKFSRAVKELTENLEDTSLDPFIENLRKVTHVKGFGELDKVFDEFFRGGLDEMYKWLFWGMAVQWGKSFGVLVGMTGDRDAGTPPKTLQSPST